MIDKSSGTGIIFFSPLAPSLAPAIRDKNNSAPLSPLNNSIQTPPLSTTAGEARDEAHINWIGKTKHVILAQAKQIRYSGP